MTIQTGVAVDVAYKAEAGFGQMPNSAGGKLIRRVSSSLALSRQTMRSNEIRPDAQLAGLRPGSRKVQGELRGELAVAAWDDFLAAALRGGWSAGVGFSGAVTASAAGRTFTRASGSWLVDGFRVGDVVRWSGLSAGNDGRCLRITALAAATMTVADTVAEASASTAGCAVTGAKLVVGMQQPSFTIEQAFAEAGFSQVFTGCRIGGLQLTLTPNRLAEITFTVLGRDMAVLEDAVSPHFTPLAPPGAHQPLAAIDATLRLGDRDVGVVTGLELKVDLGLVADAVLGTSGAPEVLYGRTLVSGVMTAFVEDAGLLKHFAAGDELALHLLLAPQNGGGFVSLYLPRLSFTGGDVKVEGDRGVPIRLPFQALIKTDDSTCDATTIAIQTSAA